MTCWIRCQEEPHVPMPALIDLDTGNQIAVDLGRDDTIPRVVLYVLREGIRVTQVTLFKSGLAECINLISALGEELWHRGYGIPDISRMLELGREIAKEKENTK